MYAGSKSFDERKNLDRVCTSIVLAEWQPELPGATLLLLYANYQAL